MTTTAHTTTADNPTAVTWLIPGSSVVVNRQVTATHGPLAGELTPVDLTVTFDPTLMTSSKQRRRVEVVLGAIYPGLWHGQWTPGRVHLIADLTHSAGDQ